MIVLWLFAFLSGLVTILSPCIWPLLPIVLSSSAAGKGQKRPFGITLGIMLSFAIFTLSISTLVRLFHFDPNILRLLAVIVIGVFGIAMIFPAFSQLLEGAISRLSGLLGQQGSTGKVKQGFWPGFVTGLSLGIVWSPCAGPILASIAALSVTGTISLALVLVTLFYVTGVGIPLFIFSYGGRSLLTRTRVLSPYTQRIQQIFGVIMLLTAFAIFTNIDQLIQAKLVNLFPAYSNALTALESNDAVKSQLDSLKGSKTTIDINGDSSGLFNVTPSISAPEFTGITHWLNLPAGTPAPTMKSLKGKVVLVDFWTYTCINCIRTLPFVTSWYDKYKNDGFVVVGVHTPEFEFEKKTENVEDAIKRFSIHYPVAQDNEYGTWNAYSNQYWPAEYLIDAEGEVRRADFGEGQYDQMEKAIQALLQETGKQVNSQLSQVADQTPLSQISPETYLGARRAEYYYLTGQVEKGTKTFQTENSIPLNTYSLGGTWTIQDENMVSGDKAELVYHFTAEKVFLVMGPGKNSPATVNVLLDGKPVSQSLAGDDVHNGQVEVTGQRLYSLINLHGKSEDHTLKLQFKTPQTEVFAFTFG